MKNAKIKITEIVNTCIACPSQWEAMDEYGRPIYIRFRGGYLSVRVGEKGQGIESALAGNEIFCRKLDDEFGGYISFDELKRELRDGFILPAKQKKQKLLYTTTLEKDGTKKLIEYREDEE